jgi:hypothetical protein
MRWTFPAGIFLGSCLLFLVQPMVAKALLPWFGGSAAVWTTCLVFFQALLLVGYLYAHALVTRVSARRQAWVHAGLVGLALLGLAVAALGFGSPAVPGRALAPHGADGPVPLILAILAGVVGLPYLVLAANGPLLQAWYARCFPGRSPYRLYALSNAGSLLGLLGYPFLLEPVLELEAQGWLWTGLFVVGLGTCLLLAGRASLRAPFAEGAAFPSSGSRPAGSLPETLGAGRAARLAWLVLAAGSTGLLMAVSNQLGLDVAAVPFLWVLPLSVYLLTFVLCFERERLYVRPLFLLLWAGLALAAGARLWGGGGGSPWSVIAMQLGLLGAGCMLCHGELARAKPGPAQLTSFYAYVALGGALGGALVGVVAPAVLSGPWEYPLSLGWVSLIAMAALRLQGRWFRNGLLRGLVWVAGCVWLLMLVFALALERQSALEGAAFLDRSFFGVLRIDRDDPEEPLRERLVMVHGDTVHGYQFVAPERRRLATAYYGETSGVGRCLRGAQALRPARPMRIGVIGLGVGTLATYARPGDLVRFYEIDPLVVRLARGEGGFFSYLADSAGQIEVRLGDGRLLLEAELRGGEPRRFDLLVVDAFGSDAIPVHLLTREAFSLYREHLAPQTGVLALHLSNKALDLRGLAWAQGQQQGLHSRLVVDPGDGLERQRSTWMLFASQPEALELPTFRGLEGAGWHPSRAPRPWTDRYSNLLDVLR